MIKKQATVKNAYGIHCRPSGVISKAVKGYEGSIEITGPDGSVANPRSVLALLGLALTPGDTVIIAVDGAGEEEVCDRLVQLFESNFDFQR